MQTIDLLGVRLVIALLLAFKAFTDFFATALTVAYRTGALGIAERLGKSTPGDDYRRLIPLMEAAPAWLHGLWVLAGVLYLLAIACVLLRKRAAHLVVLAAVGVEILATLVEQPIEQATGVIVNPNPNFIASVIIPFVLPLLLAVWLWQVARQTPESPGTLAPR